MKLLTDFNFNKLFFEQKLKKIYKKSKIIYIRKKKKGNLIKIQGININDTSNVLNLLKIYKISDKEISFKNFKNKNENKMEVKMENVTKVEVQETNKLMEIFMGIFVQLLNQRNYEGQIGEANISTRDKLLAKLETLQKIIDEKDKDFQNIVNLHTVELDEINKKLKGLKIVFGE